MKNNEVSESPESVFSGSCVQTLFSSVNHSKTLEDYLKYAEECLNRQIGSPSKSGSVVQILSDCAAYVFDCNSEEVKNSERLEKAIFDHACEINEQFQIEYNQVVIEGQAFFTGSFENNSADFCFKNLDSEDYQKLADIFNNNYGNIAESGKLLCIDKCGNPQDILQVLRIEMAQFCKTILPNLPGSKLTLENKEMFNAENNSSNMRP